MLMLAGLNFLLPFIRKLDLGAGPNLAKAVYFPKKILLTIELEFTDWIF